MQVGKYIGMLESVKRASLRDEVKGIPTGVINTAAIHTYVYRYTRFFLSGGHILWGNMVEW